MLNPEIEILSARGTIRGFKNRVRYNIRWYTDPVFKVFYDSLVMIEKARPRHFSCAKFRDLLVTESERCGSLKRETANVFRWFFSIRKWKFWRVECAIWIDVVECSTFRLACRQEVGLKLCYNSRMLDTFLNTFHFSNKHLNIQNTKKIRDFRKLST